MTRRILTLCFALRLQWGTTGIAMKIKAPYRLE